MIQKIACKKCGRNFNVDFDKATKDEFLVACPGCQQKYKLKKPSISQSKSEVTGNESEVSRKEVALKQIPCPTCAKILKVDLSKISKYPAIIACGACKTKIKLNDPNVKKEIKTGKLEEVRKPSSIQIDKNAIDPKNHFTYKLYYHTRKIDQISKVTLFIYLSYLVSSIAKTLSKPTISNLDAQSFLKLRADANALSMQAFNRSVNPVLKENGINPRMTSWASGWFVKKLSTRIVMSVLESMKIDMNLPYIKKFKQEINSENNKVIQFVTSNYLIFGVCMALHLFIMLGVALDHGFQIANESFFQIILALVVNSIPAWGAYKTGSIGLSKSIIISNIYILYAFVVVNIFGVSTYDFTVHEFIVLFHAFINLVLIAWQVLYWLKKLPTISGIERFVEWVNTLQLKIMATALLILLTLASIGTYATNRIQTNSEYSSEIDGSEIQESFPVQPSVDTLSMEQTIPDVVVDTAEVTSEVYFHIQDPDGYSNLRDEPNGYIIRQVFPNEQFRVTDSIADYMKVLLNDGTTGYIHKSRVFLSESSVN